MTFYMAGKVMIWNGLQTNEIDKASGDKQVVTLKGVLLLPLE